MIPLSVDVSVDAVNESWFKMNETVINFESLVYQNPKTKRSWVQYTEELINRWDETRMIVVYTLFAVSLAVCFGGIYAVVMKKGILMYVLGVTFFFLFPWVFLFSTSLELPF